MEGEELEEVALMPLPEKTSRTDLSRATFTRAPWELVIKERRRKSVHIVYCLWIFSLRG